MKLKGPDKKKFSSAFVTPLWFRTKQVCALAGPQLWPHRGCVAQVHFNGNDHTESASTWMWTWSWPVLGMPKKSRMRTRFSAWPGPVAIFQTWWEEEKFWLKTSSFSVQSLDMLPPSPGFLRAATLKASGARFKYPFPRIDNFWRVLTPTLNLIFFYAVFEKCSAKRAPNSGKMAKG